jgi:cbb3-type cytochrome oxidase subunit 3
MTMFIFLGDMAVMAFMIGLAIWFTNKSNDEQINQAARIPLEDEDYHG